MRILAALLTATAMFARADGGSPGAQQLTRWVGLCEGSPHTAGIAIGDLDHDGDPDLVFANGRHLPELDWVYVNNGHGGFNERIALHDVADPSYGVALADFDGDGDLDAAVANDIGAASLVLSNDGSGRFSVTARLGTPRARRAVAAGDVNGDGRPDIVLVGLGQSHVYQTEADGRSWTEHPLGDGGSGRATGVALADVNGDRRLDIVVPGRYEAPNRLFINNGSARWDVREIGTASDDMTSVAAGDLDADGDIDLFLTSWDRRHQILRNEGDGRFGAARLVGDGDEHTWAAALADMDLDGDLDAIVANANVGFWSEDVNGDKQPERTGAQARHTPSRVYLNNGRGMLGRPQPFGAGGDNARPVAAADLDNDGDPDVVLGTDCQTNYIFFNQRRRQLR